MSNVIPYITAVAERFLAGKLSPNPCDAFKLFSLDYEWFVQPKQRARASKAGHHYTPKETRDFENDVRSAAIKSMIGGMIMLRPVAVHLTIYDKYAADKFNDVQHYLAEHNLLFADDKGDLDNCVKAIMDALNGVVYKDDRQVVQFFITRKYNPHRAGFKISIRETGFSRGMLEMLYKALGRNRDGSKG